MNEVFYVVAGRNHDGYVFFVPVMDWDGKWVLGGGAKPPPTALYLLPSITRGWINANRDWLRDRIKEYATIDEGIHHYGYPAQEGETSLLPLAEETAEYIKSLGLSKLY